MFSKESNLVIAYQSLDSAYLQSFKITEEDEKMFVQIC